MVEFGFCEPNAELVALGALGLVLGDLAGALRSLLLAVLKRFRFLTRAALLLLVPFEPNCFLRPFGSYPYELVDALMEVTVVYDL